MTHRVVVTGTDTGLGKTVFAAALTGALDGCYWKPLQSGTEDGTDADVVRRLSGLSADRVLAEAHVFRTPVSPHQAAEIDGASVNATALNPPACDRPLVIEGAGGLMVPVTRETLFIDIFARWAAPTVLVARTALGTINHSLLSIEAMRKRGIPILGVAFVGEEFGETERVICDFGKVRHLGRLPTLDPLDSDSLAAAFAAHFSVADFAAGAPTT
jgi:dethiobiotin synthetase